jgi:hypothetical protein
MLVVTDRNGVKMIRHLGNYSLIEREPQELGDDLERRESAVSAIVKDDMGGPIPGVKINAYHAGTGRHLGRAVTDHQGQAKIDLPVSGLPVKLVPELSFFKASEPEEAIVKSLPISGFLVKKWDWDESAIFYVYNKKFQDFLTTTNIIILVVIGLGAWWFFMRSKEE